ELIQRVPSAAVWRRDERVLRKELARARSREPDRREPRRLRAARRGEREPGAGLRFLEARAACEGFLDQTIELWVAEGGPPLRRGPDRPGLAATQCLRGDKAIGADEPRSGGESSARGTAREREQAGEYRRGGNYEAPHTRPCALRCMKCVTLAIIFVSPIQRPPGLVPSMVARAVNVWAKYA